jgi:hypothetical protein
MSLWNNISGALLTDKTSLPGRNKLVHLWAKQLQLRLVQLGLKASTVTPTVSKQGWCSAYFAVKDIGEVRVSDHPMNEKHPTSDVSIGDASSYVDVCTRYVAEHNRLHEKKIFAVDDTPFIIPSTERSIRSWNAQQAQRVATREAKEGAHAREVEKQQLHKAFWDEEIRKSGLKGDEKTIKKVLLSQGVRYR